MVLLTRRDPPSLHDAHRQSFRTYAAEHQTIASTPAVTQTNPSEMAVGQQRVRYAYVYEETQGVALVAGLTFGEGVHNHSTGAVQV